MDFYMNIHPFLSRGLYYNLITHPLHSSNEYLMVNENGAIEAYTKDIGHKLGLFSLKDSTRKNSFVLEDISQELARINLAYNMINLKDKSKQVKKEAQLFSKMIEEPDKLTPKEIEPLSDNLSLGDAEALCKAFDLEGKPIVLTSLKTTQDNIPLVYQCKVQTQFYGQYFVKLIVLEKVEVDREEIEQARNFIWKPSDEANKNTRTTLLMQKPSNNKIIEIYSLEKSLTGPTFLKPGSDNIEKMLDSYQVDNEKESCDLTDAQIDEINSSKLVKKSKTLVSITKQSIYRETKLEDQGLKIPSSKNGNNTPSQGNKIDEVFAKKWEEEEKNAVEKLEIAQQSLGSQKSKSSAQGRVSKALKEALLINYYPRYYNVFVVVFYSLLLMIFACHLTLKLTFDEDVADRKEEKDVIRSAETRNDLLNSIQADLKYMLDLHSGRLKPQDLGLLEKSVSEYIESIGKSLIYLGSLNNKLLLASKGLEAQFRQELFEANVRVYETDFNEPEEKFMYLNNFQATKRIVESAFKGLNLAKTDMAAAMPYFNFIFRNALNDFLVKCDEISDLFLHALDHQEEDKVEIIEYMLIATGGLAFIIIAISAAVVVRQYETEKKYMLAFLRLNHVKVKEILDGIVRFKRVLEEDSSFDEVSSADISKFTKTTSQKTEMRSKKIKQVHMQNFDLRGIFRKYLQYWFNVIFLMIIVVSFVAVNYVVANDTIAAFHLELHQIQFSDRISARLNVAVGTTQEMLSKTNTTLIRNQPAPTQIEISIEDVKIMRKELSYMFNTEGDAAYDSIVQRIVFEDACSYLNDVPAKVCESIKQGTENVGLLYAISLLEDGITSRRDQYQISNKAFEGLLEIEVDTFQRTVYPNVVLNYATTVLSETIEKVYEKQILDAQTQSDFIWGATCVMTFLVAMLAWFGLLKKVREADGKFKKVLQTLPPTLILSNFVLKSYLLETSQGTLDFVRNDI